MDAADGCRLNCWGPLEGVVSEKCAEGVVRDSGSKNYGGLEFYGDHGLTFFEMVPREETAFVMKLQTEMMKDRKEKEPLHMKESRNVECISTI